MDAPIGVACDRDEMIEAAAGHRPRRALMRCSTIRSSASIAKPTMPIAIIPLITIDVLMLAWPLTSR